MRRVCLLAVLRATGVGTCSRLTDLCSLDVERAHHELLPENGEERHTPGPRGLRLQHFTAVGFERTLWLGRCRSGLSDPSNFRVDRVAA